MKADLVDFLRNIPFKNVGENSLHKIDAAIGLSQRNKELNYATQSLQDIKKKVAKLGNDYSAIVPHLKEVYNLIVPPNPPEPKRFF